MAGCVAIVGATVLSPRSAVSRTRSTVVVRGDRIVAVGSPRSVRVPDDAEVLDGRGRFLIPGLMDMHVHQSGYDAVDPALFLANGVTTVREMSGSPMAREWRDRTAVGTLFGPRPVVGSPMLDGSPSLWTGLGAAAVEIADAAAAREAVRASAADGADFIKVYTRLSSESFHAVAEESHRLGLPFAGHCPDDVPVTQASAAGQRSFEHLFTTWYAASSHERAIREALDGMTVEPGGYVEWFQKIHPLDLMAARSYDPGRAARVFARLARNGSHQVPTFTMHRAFDRPDLLDRDDPRLRYVPATTRESWAWQLAEIYQAGRTAQHVAEHRELFGRRAGFLADMHRSGVPVMAGTDTGTPYCFPGFSLHDELELLVAAGLSPAHALSAATWTPARFLGLTGVTGTVGQGTVADLVLLDADPLADIRNTRRVHAVVVRGRLITADQREHMLDDVAAACAASPVPV